ncbi:TlpA disulfide reductase family protein [Sinisalibacter aestuarii]|uniref:Thioredoxin n=1 Tax=Sinisalibacter aestuarii TaxID=2949426 RepID=A0ABQ5LN61_9RHOB|nr:TlpA disulfide reductase family protein [Sinisalibacter aestuarii]GKY86218.1 thioredoxin [Sinisalibacter aestuarii]
MLRSALLYAALLFGANAAFAADPAVLEALKQGEMKRLVVHDAPKPSGLSAFTDRDGGSHSLADWQGKVVLLNFWAVSCVPCREEMPALNALEKELGGEDFAVVPVAFGYNHPGGLARFITQYEIDALPVLLDPDRRLSAEMGVIAPPVTMLLDREGNEVARFIGGAEWDSDEAKAIIATLIADPAS